MFTGKTPRVSRFGCEVWFYTKKVSHERRINVYGRSLYINCMTRRFFLVFLCFLAFRTTFSWWIRTHQAHSVQNLLGIVFMTLPRRLSSKSEGNTSLSFPLSHPDGTFWWCSEKDSTAHQEFRSYDGNVSKLLDQKNNYITHPGSTGVIYVMDRAQKMGYHPGDPTWGKFPLAKRPPSPLTNHVSCFYSQLWPRCPRR